MNRAFEDGESFAEHALLETCLEESDVRGGEGARGRIDAEDCCDQWIDNLRELWDDVNFCVHM